MNAKYILASTLAIVLLSACSASVRTPSNDRLGKVEIQGGGGPVGSNSTAIGQAPLNSATNDATTFGERYDETTEQSVAQDTLKAWRTAVKHSKQGATPEAEWKRLRAEDEKSAMAQLDDVRERFPTSSTVRFMMGQVKAHFGKHAEATEHFRASMENNTNNSMYLFKLAESQSKAGQNDDAIASYRKLLEHNSRFAPAQVGLARTLMQKDPKNAEAKQLLATVLEHEPDNVEAKRLLSPTTDAKPAQ